jgi:Uma2 family endonuclease
VTGKREVDLAVDPPPDLVIEIEISRRMIDRVDLYARLAVPEVWRCDGKRLDILLLNDQGYQPSVRSAAFPQIATEQIVSLIEQSWLTDETTWAESARKWLQAQLNS